MEDKQSFDKTIYQSWDKILIENEKEFVNNFLLRTNVKKKLVKNEAFYKALLARHFIQHLYKDSCLNEFNKLVKSECLTALGIEVNYQVKYRHDSCLKRVAGSFSESRQADLCFLDNMKVLYMLEIKSNSQSNNEKEGNLDSQD